MRHIDMLKSNGLLNVEAPDLSVLMGGNQPRILMAFCSSQTCAGTISTKVQKFNVHQDETHCPDCHNVLFWKENKKKKPVIQ